eukprot:5634450-Prymnesium_polylepis.2
MACRTIAGAVRLQATALGACDGCRCDGGWCEDSESILTESILKLRAGRVFFALDPLCNVVCARPREIEPAGAVRRKTAESRRIGFFGATGRRLAARMLRDAEVTPEEQCSPFRSGLV